MMGGGGEEERAIDKQWKKEQASRCCTADVCLHHSVNQGVDSIDINYGPKCQIENWQIGRLGQAYAHWQNWPENWPENQPKIFYVN